MTFEPPGCPYVNFARCHDLHEDLNGYNASPLPNGLRECLSLDDCADADVPKRFAERVQDSLHDKHQDRALLPSLLLLEPLVRGLFTHVWVPAVCSGCFTTSIAKPTPQNLFMATASCDTALHLRRSEILKVVATIEDAPSAYHRTRKLVLDIRERVEGWEELQDPRRSSFGFFVPWVEHILPHEASLGIFILSILSAPVVLDVFEDLPRILLVSSTLCHSDLWALGRALVGVGVVLAALAWADAADEPGAAPRTLGVLRVWQARAGDYGPRTPRAAAPAALRHGRRAARGRALGARARG